MERSRQSFRVTRFFSRQFCVGKELTLKSVNPTKIRWRRRALVCLLLTAGLLSAAALAGCDNFFYEATQPPYYETFEVSGSPYERGFQHGERFASKIRSMYTMLLETSIFPYLNRERDDVASVMLRYQDEDIYGDGKFSGQMMSESAYDLLPYLPDEFVEEMHGIADGANYPFERILVMNTFFDTLMGFRSITFFIKIAQAPWLLTAELSGLDGDGLDNNGDGEIDEHNEGFHEYDPRSYGTFVEVPTDTVFQFTIDDNKQGVDMDSVRIQLDDIVYTTEDESIQVEPYAREGKTVLVTFTPPDGLPAASSVSLQLQCYDNQVWVRTPPHHPRSMREERITVTTVGYGKQPWQVPNQGVDDGRTQPPALGFAVRGSATKNGEIILAHNFAMLDSNIAHKHPVLIMHHPNKGPAFAALGYPGLAWGFSGMNENGLAYMFNASDSLNNSFAAAFNEGLIFGRLKPAGVPAGILGRQMLQNYSTVDEAATHLDETMPTFGWNFLLADANRDFKAVEVDGNIMGRPGGYAHIYDANPDNPESLDEFGQMLASVGPDDLFVASHFQKNLNEIDYDIVNFELSPQKIWSSFYLRSVRAFWNTADTMRANYGEIDYRRAQKLLAKKDLEDQRDSMNSVVYRPETLKLYVAAGDVPCTNAGFKLFDLGARLEEGDKQ
jgi:Acyl-coenzyme A:6-aminopenicillanic acid acyl-transferase